jgi:phosphate transport system permease protein
MLFFVVALGWGLSLLAGAFTLAIMILPLIMRTTEEALISVPDSYREGSFGLAPDGFGLYLLLLFHQPYPAYWQGLY